MNRLKAEFIRKLSEYFVHLPFSIRGKRLCVCLSGGADSVSLLYGMLEIANEFAVSLCACHFNHMMRGDEADRDEEFCKNLCKSLDVELYCGRDNVPAFARVSGMTMEEAARECRYSFFSRINKKNSIDYCLTAHNMNDDAETLLMNLIRGSGGNGASSISPYKDNILRPLLKISRTEIENYLSSIGCEYVIDSTNASNEYTRNRIRNLIFPALKEINPSVIQAFSRFCEASRVDRDYFESVTDTFIDSDLRLMHKAIRTRVILRKCKERSGIILNNAMLNEIDNAIFSDKRTVLPLNVEYDVCIDGGQVNFYKSDIDHTKIVEPRIIDISENNMIFDGKAEIHFALTPDDSKKINKLSTSVLLTFDRIVGSLYVRNRREGDRICIHGVNKSVKKLFNEKRIPKEYRNIIPVLCDDLGIIYIPFVGIADRAYPKNNNTKLYVNTLFNSIDKERWVKAYEK